MTQTLIIDVITALNWFPGCEKPIDAKNTSLRDLKQSYSTLPCSGGHFGFCPLAANAQGEIQGTLSKLLRGGF